MLFKNFRALFFTLLIILSFGLLAGPAVFAQERDWQPQRTWVFIVGTLKWKHSDVFSSFPQKNRREAQLVDFFRQQGVHADQLVYLQDAQATTRRVKSCYSGSLAQQTRGMNRRVSYAALTSASADELSTENWTFTEMLLAGLRGKAFADINGDGRVTLGELAEDVNEDMAFAEEQQSSFVATGKFLRDIVLAQAPPKSNPEISKRVEVKSQGDWYKARIIDARAGRFRVHYFGWEDSDDEWVLRNQIRNSKILKYAWDATVKANWQDQWDSAEVLDEVERRAHLIHYVGYDDSWDEWVRSGEFAHLNSSRVSMSSYSKFPLRIQPSR